MLAEEKNILWRISAVTFGIAMPFALIGKGLMFALLILGLITGLLATKGHSLRATVSLIFNSKIVWLLGLMLVSFLVSSILGINPEYSLSKFYEVISITLVASLIFMALREMPGRYITMLMDSLIVGMFFIMAVSVADAFSGNGSRLAVALHGQEMAFSSHRLNFIGSLMAILSPFMWAWYVRKMGEGNGLPKMSLPIAIPFAIFTIFVCGGRAGWVAVALVVPVFVWQAGKYYNLNLHAKQWLALLVSVAGGIASYGYTRGMNMLLERMEIIVAQRGIGGGRVDIWNFSIDHLMDNPFIGIGVNGFRYLPNNPDFHPHNVVLQLFLETGFTGAILAIALLGMLLFKFYTYSKSNIYGLGAFCSLLAFLVVSMFSKSLFDVQWLSIFIMIVMIGWRVGFSMGETTESKVISSTADIKEVPNAK